MSKIIIIAAIGAHNELGKDDNLIWRIKEDLQFFKQTTEYHTIVMGRKTYESLPGLLSNRRHIVLTRGEHDYPSEVIVCNSLDEVMDRLVDIQDDLFIIGGESIYRMFTHLADEMILTEVDAECEEADAYFPEIDESIWDSEVTHEFKDNNPPYLRKIYRRKNI